MMFLNLTCLIIAHVFFREHTNVQNVRTFRDKRGGVTKMYETIGVQGCWQIMSPGMTRLLNTPNLIKNTFRNFPNISFTESFYVDLILMIF